MSDTVGYIRMTYEELAKILNLPEDVKIVGIDSGAFVHEQSALHITLSHPTFPLNVGGPVQALSQDTIEACRHSKESTLSTQ